ncbi:neuromedin-U isoform X1 [Polyodon spathula]|uniref:neuromedin-U isoform X1 n=1 Tax=Polyodon spathula TaxID=7913 RepID=UPI001B7E10EA|nr:neuromedin-U isoform X1 [Polyodon spathula]
MKTGTKRELMMLSSTLCQHRPLHTGSNSSTTTMRNPHCIVTLTLLILLITTTPTCKGAPASLQELQVWNEIEDVCSSFLSTDPQSQASRAIEELCYMAWGIVYKSQDLKGKDHTKRFLFHYSKTHDSGNSDIMSSVLHPLLQLVPQLHVRRLKRFRDDDDLQGPGGIQSRGYFLFRPRNGKRSTTFA